MKRGPNWKGGKRQSTSGYIQIWMPEHQRQSNGYIPEHIFIAEKVLGAPLPNNAEVHHFNEIRNDNRNENLVICESHDFHALLHKRKRAYEACGFADWRKCWHCQKWGDPREMQEHKVKNKDSVFHHKICQTLFDRLQMRKRRAKLLLLTNSHLPSSAR